MSSKQSSKQSSKKSSKNLSIQKSLVFALIILAVTAFFALDISHYFSFAYLKENQLQFNDYYQSHPFIVSISFFTIYIVSTAFSLPGATLLTLIGGAVFGFIWGLANEINTSPQIKPNTAPPIRVNKVAPGKEKAVETI